MKSRAGFEFRMSTSENQNKPQNSSSLSPISSLLLSLSLQLSLSQIKHKLCLQIDLPLVLQSCNAIFWPKNVCNQAITFWPNFCHLVGKTYAYLDLQPIQILLCLISKKSFMLATSLCNYASCLPREPPCLSRYPGTTHVSEHFYLTR